MLCWMNEWWIHECLAYVLLWELFILFVYVFVENEKCHSLACQLLNLKMKSTGGNVKIFIMCGLDKM